MVSRDEQLLARDEDWRRIRVDEAIAFGRAGEYKSYHSYIALSHASLDLGKVLVVGCNRGEDCEIFVEMGASSVVGVDVMDEIGINFIRPNVSYIKCSAEEIDCPDDTFDLVFSYATMEHVPHIYPAFREMARVCRPGGIIYSAAAPLWNSRYGPHWGDAMSHVPWAHLRMTPNQMEAVNASLNDRDGTPIPTRAQLDSWLDDAMFNKRPAFSYVNACNVIDGIDIIRNNLELEADAVLDDDIFAELSAMGFTRTELLALTHIFIARKREQ